MWTRKDDAANPQTKKSRRHGYRGYGSPSWGERQGTWGRWFGGALMPEAGLPPAHAGKTVPNRA
jgi:hypothetical protein